MNAWLIIFVYCFVAYGLSNMVVFGSGPFRLAGTGLWWLALILDCCFTSGVVWLIHHIETFFENLGGGENDIEENDDVIQINS